MLILAIIIADSNRITTKIIILIILQMSKLKVYNSLWQVQVFPELRKIKSLKVRVRRVL